MSTTSSVSNPPHAGVVETKALTIEGVRLSIQGYTDGLQEEGFVRVHECGQDDGVHFALTYSASF